MYCFSIRPIRHPSRFLVRYGSGSLVCVCVCVSKFGVCVRVCVEVWCVCFEGFGVCVCVVQLVEIGGVRREALLGVGPQTISVMEAHNLKVSSYSLDSKNRHSFT